MKLITDLLGASMTATFAAGLWFLFDKMQNNFEVTVLAVLGLTYIVINQTLNLLLEFIRGNQHASVTNQFKIRELLKDPQAKIDYVHFVSEHEALEKSLLVHFSDLGAFFWVLGLCLYKLGTVLFS